MFQLIVAAIVGATLEANDGRWIYPIDDAYITLTLSRNLAETGVMGVNRGVFSATSSTPLYTVLLAGIFKLTGTRELVPLVVNLIAASAVLGAASALLTRLGVGPWRSLLALLALVVATPLPTLALSGMEHTLQILASLLFVIAFLARSRMVSIAAMAMVGLRYENIGLVVIALAVLGYRREWGSAARTLAGALVVPAAMALASWSNGWPLIPASILLKASVKHPDPWIRLLDPAGFKAIRNLISAPHLLALLGVILSAFRSRPAIAGTAVAAILIHAQFGAIGWLFRYEAYVVALGIIAVAALPGVRAAAAIVLTGVLGWRAYQAVETGIGASTNIYAQQYQMGQFFRDHYPGKAIALNDIGAVSFLGHSPVVDLYGLGHRDVFETKRRNGPISPTEIDSITKRENVEIAAVFDSWFPQGLPPHWVRAGSWQVPENYILGSDRVTFYATSEEAAIRLRSQLAQYRPRLPERVSIER